jgi:transcriptional regulator with XRE-family HTH domain
MGDDIGKLIKEMRNAVGMSQGDLAEKLDVSPRQVQKFEEGAGLTVTRLLQIADAFGVPVKAFNIDAGGQSTLVYPALLPDEIRLVGLYRRIKSRKLKEGIIEMLESLEGF